MSNMTAVITRIYNNTAKTGLSYQKIMLDSDVAFTAFGSYFTPEMQGARFSGTVEQVNKSGRTFNNLGRNTTFTITWPDGRSESYDTSVKQGTPTGVSRDVIATINHTNLLVRAIIDKLGINPQAIDTASKVADAFNGTPTGFSGPNGNGDKPAPQRTVNTEVNECAPIAKGDFNYQVVSQWVKQYTPGNVGSTDAVVEFANKMVLAGLTTQASMTKVRGYLADTKAGTKTPEFDETNTLVRFVDTAPAAPQTQTTHVNPEDAANNWPF